MNKTRLLIGAIVGVFLLGGCISDDETTSEGNWVQRSYIEGSNRSNAAAFSIDSRAFIMGGYTGDEYLSDFWEYNATGDYWIKKADFPGQARSNAVAFSIDGKGYVGTGYDGTNKLNDFWEYDPETDTWMEVASFGDFRLLIRGILELDMMEVNKKIFGSMILLPILGHK